MKAIYIPSYLPSSSPYSSLTPTEIPSPKPSPNNVVVRIAYSALNHVDLLYSRGLHQNNHSGLFKPPFTLGLEFSGVVIHAPPESGFQPGDKVWGGGLGSHAEYIACPPKTVRKLPHGISLKDAAGIGAGTAPVSYGALVRCAEIKKGDVVLVHAAAGGLGVVACQIAHALGCRVIGTVGSEAKANALRENLKGVVVGVVRYDNDGWEKEVVKMAGGEGVDVVYDTVGLVLSSIRCIKFGGKIVIAGFAGRDGKLEELKMNRVLLKNAKLLGYRFGESGRKYPKEMELCWEGVDELITNKGLWPVIYRTYMGLDKVGEGLEDLKARKIWGKGLVEVAREEDLFKDDQLERARL